jgi:hypothetical protein
MAAACSASFAAALFYARALPAAGYFTTHTRLYELGMGGLLVVAAGPRPLAYGSGPGTSAFPQTWLRTAAALAGLAAIGASAAVLSARTDVPGAAALVPTLGTSALVWAGEQDRDDDAPAHALVAPMSHPVLQYLGEISYSLYLAHWPVVVIYPFATGRAVEGVLADGVLVCVVSFALAHACKRCWEDRFRATGGGSGETKPKQPLTTAADGGSGGATGLPPPGSCSTMPRRCRPRLSPGVGALVMTLLLVTATLSASYALHRASPRITPEVDALAPTELQTNGSDTAAASANVTESEATVVASPRRRRLPPSPECDSFLSNATRPYPGADAALHRCANLNTLPVEELVALAEGKSVHRKKPYPNVLAALSGAPKPTSQHRPIVILGDSHGYRWQHAFSIVGRWLGIKVINLYKSGCAPGLEEARHEAPQNTATKSTPCQEWNAASVEKVMHMQPSAVVMVAYKKRTPADAVVAGLVRVARKIVAAGIPVLYIKSTPLMGKRTLDCMAQEARRDSTSFDLLPCSLPRDSGVSDGVMEMAASIYPMMRRLSFDDIFCPGDTCPPAIGNVIVYADGHHLTKAFSQSLADVLLQRLLEKAPHLAGNMTLDKRL